MNLTRSLEQKQGPLWVPFVLPRLGVHTVGMPDKTFLVLLKPPNGTFQHVIAARTKKRGDHLAFLDEDGRLVASFLMDLVESWVEFMSLEEVMWVLKSAELNSQKQKSPQI
jgi:hypothetical protein